MTIQIKDHSMIVLLLTIQILDYSGIQITVPNQSSPIFEFEYHHRFSLAF